MNGDLRENCRLLDEKLHRAVNPDMHVRFFRTFSRDAAVYYVDGLISTDFMQHYLLFPLQNAAETVSSGEIAACIRQRVALCEVETFFDVREIVAQLVSGHAVVLADGMDCALSFDVRGAVRRGISPPLTESVVRGPHQGFNESIRDSITLLRRILPTPELIGEMRQIGDAIPVSLCVMYLQNAVDESSLSRLKARLEEVHIDHVLSIGALEQLLEDHPFSLLPQCVMTERPDRAASMLLEGQIVLLLDGSPQVLVLPASLLHLLHTPDDTSSRWLYGTFMRLIRLLGMLCALMLPAGGSGGAAHIDSGKSGGSTAVCAAGNAADAHHVQPRRGSQHPRAVANRFNARHGQRLDPGTSRGRGETCASAADYCRCGVQPRIICRAGLFAWISGAHRAAAPACGGQHLRRLRHRAVHDGALRPPVQPDEPWRTLRRSAFAAACA